MDNSLSDKKWFQELLILVVAFLLSTLNTYDLFTNWNDGQKAIIIFLITYIHAQANRFLLLPFLLQKHKAIVYAACSMLLVFLFAAILYVVYRNFWQRAGSNNLTGLQQYLVHVVCCLLSLITMLTPFLLLHFYKIQKKQAAGQLALNQMELRLLQSQLNPVESYEYEIIDYLLSQSASRDFLKQLTVS